jgi:Flp pilus assembly pilin Flp
MLNQKNRSRGQTLVEYALIVAFASLIVMAFLTFLGGNLISFFSKVTNTLGGAAS